MKFQNWCFIFILTFLAFVNKVESLNESLEVSLNNENVTNPSTMILRKRLHVDTVGFGPTEDTSTGNMLSKRVQDDIIGQIQQGRKELEDLVSSNLGFDVSNQINKLRKTLRDLYDKWFR